MFWLLLLGVSFVVCCGPIFVFNCLQICFDASHVLRFCALSMSLFVVCLVFGVLVLAFDPTTQSGYSFLLVAMIVFLTCFSVCAIKIGFLRVPTRENLRDVIYLDIDNLRNVQLVSGKQRQ